MESKKTFKTKTGFCYISTDQIILTRKGTAGEMANISVGKFVTPILLFYGALSIVLLYIAFDYYQKGETFTSVVIAILSVRLLYGIITSSNNSAAPIIERNKIREVRFKKAIIGLTRSRFEVFFEDNNGKIKKRLIMLPGSLIDGQKETIRAVKIMKDEKLISEE